MAEYFHNILLSLPRLYVTEVELFNRLLGSAASRRGRIKRAVASGDLIRLRRGLYIVGERWRRGHLLESYEIAQGIYGPSFISLESALSYHGLIPEAVYTMTSVTTKRRKSFNTPLGQFSYQSVPSFNFYIGAERIEDGGSVYFMASPWRAIADFIYCHKLDWKGLAPLEESLRIDPNDIARARLEDVEALVYYFKSRRVTRFFQNIVKELEV